MPITKEISLKKKNKIARNTHQKLIKAKDLADVAYLYVGRELKKIREDKLYKYLGESPEYDSFHGYVSSPEVGIEYRKACYLIQIYETFCEDLNYQPKELKGLSWTTLRALLPITDQADMDEWVEKGRQLSRTDLETEIKQLKAGVEDSAECSHEWKKIEFWRCTECGERSKVKPNDGRIVK